MNKTWVLGRKAWVRNCILATCSAYSTKISRESCSVFLVYAKIERLCWQGVNF